MNPKIREQAQRCADIAAQERTTVRLAQHLGDRSAPNAQRVFLELSYELWHELEQEIRALEAMCRDGA